MKQKTKNILALLLTAGLIAEFSIYYSDFDLSADITIKIILITLLVCVAFIFSYFESLPAKAFLSVVTITMGIGFIVFELLVGGISGKKEVKASWNINRFEIESVKDSGFAGPADSYFLLNETYFFGLFQKKIDLNFDDLPQNHEKCLIEFKKARKAFNLCKHEEIR